VIERVVAASVHGRYLIEAPAAPRPWYMLAAFHGYAEDAEIQLERIRETSQRAGSRGWLLVAVQGLHAFYRGRRRDVVASWMTRQNRDLAIADNIAYAQSVVAEAAREFDVTARVVYAGFSQGVAMAFRAACASPLPVGGVIALGGDVPPELDPRALERIPAALMSRGRSDEAYTPAAFEEDVERLRTARCAVTPFQFDGGHEWTSAFSEAAAGFLRECR